MHLETATNVLELTAEIVSAYLSNNSVPPEDVPSLIGVVHSALQHDLSASEQPKSASKAPAVPIDKSVTPDFIVSLENGKKFKSMRRHLMTAYGMTPDQYRAKWGLPRSYPMVAPNYAKTRSFVAKTMGLGRKRAPKAEQPSAKRKLSTGRGSGRED